MKGMKMKNMLLASLLNLVFAAGLYAGPMAINGAGATFPYPIYAQWAYKYEKLTGVKLNYQSIGSGGGVAQIKARTVDFGASDAPLKADVLDKYGLMQFPMIIGGVVPVVSIKGIKAGELHLTPDVLADLFLGKITSWDDPRIKKLNAGLKLPKQAVTIVHRADGSGTTWIFTNYLSKISESWSKSVGTGKAVAWPTGIGGKGNEGVANYVRRVNGTIGYVEYAYALQNKLAHVLLQNPAGEFVSPTKKTFQAAAANADWKNAPGYYLVLTNQPGKESWPITGVSFILFYKAQEDGHRAKGILKFFDWCYRHGGDMAEKLHYVPIPSNVVDLVEENWKQQLYVPVSVWP